MKRLRFGRKKTTLFRKSPDLTVGLENEILSIGSPLAATLIRRIRPVRQQAMQAGSIHSHFPLDLLAESASSVRRVEPQVALIRRPGDIFNIAFCGKQFARLRPVCTRQE